MERSLNELGADLCAEIGKRLETRLDLLWFRSVCKSWRSHLPPPTFFPLEVPPPPGLSNLKDGKHVHFMITEHTGYLIQSSENPVMMVFEEISSKGCDDIELGGIFSASPVFYTGPNKPRDFANSTILNMQQLCVSSMFKAYHLRLASEEENKTRTKRIFEKSNLVEKIVVISSFPNTRINAHYLVASGDGDLVVAALLPNGRLSLLKTSTMEWEPVNCGDSRLDDIVNYQGKLWAVDFDGRALVLDYNAMKMTPIVPSPLCYSQGRCFVLNPRTSKITPIASPLYNNPFRNPDNNDNNNTNTSQVSLKGRKRLVEASGELYMLFPCRIPQQGEQNVIKAFLLDKRQWVEVESLGDEAFFVGSGYSFSTSKMRPYKNSGDCIFLNGMSFCRSMDNDDYPLFSEMICAGPSIGVYDLLMSKYRAISSRNYPEIYCSTLPSLSRNNDHWRYPATPLCNKKHVAHIPHNLRSRVWTRKAPTTSSRTLLA